MDKEHGDPFKFDLSQPRLAWYKQNTWLRHQDTVYWVDVELAQRNGLKFFQKKIECNHLFTTHSQLVVSRKLL